jgi:nitrogen fixation NifU-like protein
LALEELYKEVILDHYKSPRNKRDLPGAERSCSRNNPLCGDEITIHAHLESAAVAEVTFEGSGCSISQASASMLTESVTGKTLSETNEMIAGFRGMMEGRVDPDEESLGDLIALKGVVKYPVRIKCAVLAWDVLQEALSGAAPAGAGEASGAAPHRV